MRVHPEFKYQETAHSAKEHHSRCDKGRLHCPFDTTAVDEEEYCKTCSWNKK